MPKAPSRYVLLPLLGLLACPPASAAAADAPGTKPLIRVENRSRVPLDKVSIQFPSQAENFGLLPPGAVSEYREISWSYRYAPVSVSVFGSEYRIQVIDYVGEERLPPGRYTFALDLEGSVLTMEALEDQP